MSLSEANDAIRPEATGPELPAAQKATPAETAPPEAAPSVTLLSGDSALPEPREPQRGAISRQLNKRAQKSDGPNICEHLTDVAERLFAQKGVAETSVRAITSEAGVNVAAINYYFGSKEDLYQAVINRRLEPLIAERVRLLDVCQRDTTSGGPTVEHLLYALVSPSIRLCFAHPYFVLLASRLRLDSDEFLWHDYRARQEFLKQRFVVLFCAALPHLSRKEVEARLMYVLGALLQLWTTVPLPAQLSQRELLASFLTFYAAALRAPEPGAEGLAITDIIHAGYGEGSPGPAGQEDVHEDSSLKAG